MANGYKKIFKSKNFRLKLLNFLRVIPDKMMLRLEYFIKFRKHLRLKKPITFNEKLQWLKLYNRKNIYTTMVDKCLVKDFVKEKIGKEYIIPTLGKWDKFDDIDFNSLPDQFVLKCNHDSGSVIVCRDKNQLDKEKAKDLLDSALKRNMYYLGREWPYKNVKPCIFAETLIQDSAYQWLPVYKVFCFAGEPKIIQTIQNDKQPNESIDCFDKEWNLLDLRQDFPNSEKPYEKPKKLDEILNLAKVLSKDESFIRVDFYVANDKIYFSEFTFFTDSGFGEFSPKHWDDTMGEWLKLPQEKIRREK